MSLSDRMPLLRLLADGEIHSGEVLASRLGVTRAAVWKQLKAIETATGLSVSAVPGRGYRLERAVELLDEARIRAQLSPVAVRALSELQVHALVDSTNTLAAELRPDSGACAAVFCEHQVAGRGRRGRRWVSAFADSLTFSVSFTSELPMSALSGISLACGVGVAQALSQLGLCDHGLKWPNDVVFQGRKLAGVLVEASGEIEGPSLAVIGIGINWRAAPGSRADVEQPWVDLQSIGLACERNELAGRLLSALIDVCIEYQQTGLAGYLSAWRTYDQLVGEDVVVSGGDWRVSGRYLGLDEEGAMIVEGPGGRRAFTAGEVSLRRVVPE